MNEAALEEAARRAATSAANVPPAAQLYRDLPVIEEAGQQQQPGRCVKRGTRLRCTCGTGTPQGAAVCCWRGFAVWRPLLMRASTMARGGELEED